MRSDLIASGMVRNWLSEAAPEMVADWAFPHDEELEVFLARVIGAFPYIPAQFASQGALARTAIEMWHLQRVALVGGGNPTPLTPKPEQVMYYTDLNPAVVTEVGTLGYNTCVADVKKLDDLKALEGADTAIATGLFHFLEDDAAIQVIENFAHAGFRTLVFNNMDENVDEALKANWGRMGFKLIARSADDMKAIVPPGWRIKHLLASSEFYKHGSHSNLGAKFAAMDNIYYICMLIR